MNIHLLGIGGTFMSALALLAREAGYHVSGCDSACYPPVSELLMAQGIHWIEGYEATVEARDADIVIVGNAMKRGMPVLEAVLNSGKKNYVSGPQWLAQTILPRYRVMAVAGTHGKTTTTSMLAFILHEAGLRPGFLIGGVSTDFKTSASLGKGDWFVIEADEYDSAIFDKRPKLMHYQPEIAILNNLEFDHADIYANLEAIQQQFHYYLKTIPANGVLIKPRDDKALNEVVARGVFSQLEDTALQGKAIWRAEVLDAVGSHFRVWYKESCVAEIKWSLLGSFNVENGLAALAASTHAGVSPQKAADALARFKPVKRRMEIKYQRENICIYDDFAHHPTAIAKTIAALKQSLRHRRLLIVLEFASYTMKTGVHAEEMAEALGQADKVVILNPSQFDLTKYKEAWSFPHEVFATADAIIHSLEKEAKPGDGIVIMSNRGFDNIHQRLQLALDAKITALNEVNT